MILTEVHCILGYFLGHKKDTPEFGVFLRFKDFLVQALGQEFRRLVEEFRLLHQ